MNFTVQLSLPTVNRVLTAVHKLCSQAHFYYTLHQGSVSVTLGSRWYSTFCWQFILLQYVLPLGSTSTSLAIYSNPNPTFNALQGMPSLHTAEPCVEMKPENTEVKVSFKWLMSYFTFSIQCEFQWWHILFTVCSVGYNILFNYWLFLPSST